MPSLLTGKFDKPFSVFPSPHLRAPGSIYKMIWGSFLALLPILVSNIIFFGWNTLRIFIIATSSALIFEYLFQVILRRKIQIRNGHTLFLSALLAFLMPPTISSEVVVIGSFVTVIIGKEIFGGLGQNLFHPTLVGCAALLALFPTEMTEYIQMPFLTTILAIVVSGTILFFNKWIAWQSSLLYLTALIGSVFLLGENPMETIWNPYVFICAFFFITDSGTIPITKQGRALFAVGTGILTAILYLWAGPLKAIIASVLFMNALVPLIDRFVQPRLRKLQ